MEKLTKEIHYILEVLKTLRGYKSYAFPSNTSGYQTDPYKNLWANSAEMSFPLVPSAK